VSIEKLDIWSQWHLPMSLIIKDGNPIIEGFVHIYKYDGEDTAGGCGCGHEHHDCGYEGHEHHDCGCHDHDHHECGCDHDDGYIVQNDALVNMLYFAAFRAESGVRIFGLGDGDIELSADELAGMRTAVDQLGSIFGYKTGQISLEQFAQEFKDQTVYYSTLAGETADGKPAFFACSSDGEDAVQYYPVFLTEAHLREFMISCHRPAYVIMQNSLSGLLSMLDANEYTKALGAVIEPIYSCSVSFPPGLRV
jgi:hypothetical protein